MFFALPFFPSALGLPVAVLSAIMSTTDSMLLVAGRHRPLDLGITRRFPCLLVSRGVFTIISVAAIAVDSPHFPWVLNRLGPGRSFFTAGDRILYDDRLSRRCDLYLLPEHPRGYRQTHLPLRWARYYCSGGAEHQLSGLFVPADGTPASGLRTRATSGTVSSAQRRSGVAAPREPEGLVNTAFPSAKRHGLRCRSSSPSPRYAPCAPCARHP